MLYKRAYDATKWNDEIFAIWYEPEAAFELSSISGSLFDENGKNLYVVKILKIS
jgi:hypothetical protein